MFRISRKQLTSGKVPGISVANEDVKVWKRVLIKPDTKYSNELGFMVSSPKNTHIIASAIIPKGSVVLRSGCSPVKCGRKLHEIEIANGCTDETW